MEQTLVMVNSKLLNFSERSGRIERNTLFYLFIELRNGRMFWCNVRRP